MALEARSHCASNTGLRFNNWDDFIKSFKNLITNCPDFVDKRDPNPTLVYILAFDSEEESKFEWNVIRIFPK